jgi:hypothetical protein
MTLKAEFRERLLSGLFRLCSQLLFFAIAPLPIGITVEVRYELASSNSHFTPRLQPGVKNPWDCSSRR